MKQKLRKRKKAKLKRTTRAPRGPGLHMYAYETSVADPSLFMRPKRARTLRLERLAILMAQTETKAGKVLGSLGELSVDDWDRVIVELGGRLARAYVNRQLQADLEGITKPPPAPPAILLSAINPEEALAAPDKSLISTIAELVEFYRTDERSTYHSLRFHTRVHYDGLAKRIVAECGSNRLADLDAANIEGLHGAWTAQSGLSMANSLFAILRIIINFGATVLQDKECERLAGAIKRIKFPDPVAKKEPLMPWQAQALIEEARRRKKYSIALAQAFQLECQLPQKDVIGQWVPIPENGHSEIIRGNEKWISGLRWNEIDDNYVLTHTASRNGKEIKINLRPCKLVMEELARFNPRPATGPVIICETTGVPWVPGEFRRWWRKLARAVKIPDTVTNASGSSADDEAGEEELGASES